MLEESENGLVYKLRWSHRPDIIASVPFDGGDADGELRRLYNERGVAFPKPVFNPKISIGEIEAE
jgi:hypothetical protein